MKNFLYICPKSKITSLLFLSFVFIPFLTPIYAQLDRSKAPEPGSAPEINIAGYESFTLDNGLKVFVVEHHKIPRVSFTLRLNHAPVNENENTGYIGIAGELIGTATTTRTKDQINEEVDFLGASLSAWTDVVYASSLKKHSEKILDLMSDVIVNAEFKQEELDKLIKQKLSSLQESLNDPRNVSEILKNVIMFGKEHPYGEIETDSSINSITLDMCKSYYNNYYKPNTGYLSIVGDITIDEAKTLITKYFSGWQKGEVENKAPAIPEPPAGNTVVILDKPNSVQSVVKICYPVIYNPGEPDYIKANVMNTLLGGGLFRLFDNLREVHGYTYGAYSSLAPDEFTGKFIAFTSVRNEVTDSAIYEMLYEMRRIRNEKVDPTELQRVKNNVMGNFALSLENPSTIARFAMNIDKYNLPDDYYKNYLKEVAAVSIDDIQLMASKYIKPSNCYIFVVGKKDEIEKKLIPFSPSREIKYIDEKGKLSNEVEK